MLGLKPNATQAEIKAAWRSIALRTHPDKTTDPALHEEYKLASRAYSELWHPMRRAFYDEYLKMLSKCKRCEGTGVIYKQKGFTQRVSLPCPECQS